MITIQNSKGVTAEFPVVPGVLVINPTGNNPASMSGELKDIPLNQLSKINLEYSNGYYRVTVVSVSPPAPSFPPAVSNSNQPPATKAATPKK